MNSELAHDLRTAAFDLTGSARKGVQGLAELVERGMPLAMALDSDRCKLPRFYREALRVSVRHGDLPLCLAEMARYDRAVRDLRTTLMVPLVYSCGHLVFFLGALIIFGQFIGVEFKRVLEEFDTNIPYMTSAALWFATEGAPRLLWIAVLATLLLVASRLVLGRANWRFLLYSLPGIGALYRWAGTWQWLNLSRLLLERSVTLPEALSLAARGVHDANVAQTGQAIAEQIKKGALLADQMNNTGRLAPSVVPLIRWGETEGQLVAAMDQAAEMLEGRMRMHAAWLRTVIPPVATVLTGAMALMIGSVVMLPVLSLIQNLS